MNVIIEGWTARTRQIDWRYQAASPTFLYALGKVWWIEPGDTVSFIARREERPIATYECFSTYEDGSVLVFKIDSGPSWHDGRMMVLDCRTAPPDYQIFNTLDQLSEKLAGILATTPEKENA